MSFTKCPLAWPDQFPRSETHESTKRFTHYPASVRNLQRALTALSDESKMPVTDALLTSNVERPLAWPKPDDPGVALYFGWDGRSFVIPCDRFDRPEANIIGIYYVIQARRSELRLGSPLLARTAMSGFLFLPKPLSSQHWSEALGVARDASIAMIEKAFKRRAMESHPDRGGKVVDMQTLIRAREQALKERS